MHLNGKVIVVTGAAQGLGRAIAVNLAQKGASIAAIDLNQEKLDETAELCVKAGGGCKTYITNIANEAEVVETFASIAKHFIHIDGLVNNAGVLRDGLLVKTDSEGKVAKRLSLQEWQTVIDVNLTGVFLCCREAATHMVNEKVEGVIVNISSISRVGNFGQSNYSAAKAGVSALTVSWAKELARFGIRVAGIAPGFINTDMVSSMKPEALEKMTSGIPLKRLGSPDEIAHTVLFIFENDYVSGRLIEVDAGLRL